jgi:putative redox protein
MVSMTGKYLGSLRTQDIHLKSNSKILTDAPTDNNGKGEAFSPTDLVCAALSSCMMTMMGMLADREGIDLTGLTAEVTKVMVSNPRKIGEIQIVFTHTELKATEIQKQKLKNAALTCPVAYSLNESIKQTIEFKLG